MILETGLLFFITCIASKSAEATECYSCVNASYISNCTSIVTCSPGSSCFSEYVTFHGNRSYTLGCKFTSSCTVVSTVSSGGVSIVGRSTSGPASCSECCSTSNCNRQLCQSLDSSCADKQGFDCTGFGDNFNVCGDISHSKLTCRRFCGYCDTIDGGWSSWSEWSACDVTCGNGMMTKSRTCSAPAPKNGGSDCPGETQLHENCTKDICPIHGGWSAWTAWGLCSSSCDIGQQRRDRSCSKPYPAHNGDQCYGDSRDDRLCFPGACADGIWSTWGSWGVCTKTCGGGFQTRNRRCDNPAPSMTGTYCSGDTMQIEACSTSPCKGQAVGFTMKSPKQSSTSGQLTFGTTISNVGGGYNVTTGVFTCSIPGYYYFSASLLKDYSYESSAFCFIYKNSVDLVQAYTYPGHTPKTGYYATVNSVHVHLDAGDNVTLAGCTAITSLHERSSFSGFLVTADVN